MKKEIKNIITRDLIKNELVFYNSADIRSTVVLILLIALACVPVTFYISFFVSWDGEGRWLEIILFVIVCVIINLPLCGLLWGLKGCLKTRKKLKKDEFNIVICKVQYKDEKIVYPYSKRFQKLLHFEGFKQCVVSNFYFEFFSPGDEFYIVHYKNDKNIEMLYPVKLYDLK